MLEPEEEAMTDSDYQAGVRCRASSNGKHEIMRRAFPHNWICGRCPAVLHLSVWRFPEEPGETT